MTENRKPRRIPQPLFVKLLYVFLGTGILILTAVAGYLMFLSPEEPPHYFLRRGLQKCTASLASEIGSPPNFEHAQELASELGLNISITTNDGKTWQSSGFEATSAQPYKVSFRGSAFNFYLQQSSPNTTLLRQILWLIVLLAFILAVSFWVMRFVFKPLRQIMSGVDAIAMGQLDYQMPYKPGGEFEILAKTFNQMTTRVKEMIKAREQLLIDLSHELRSPLARMQVSSEFIDKPELLQSVKEDLREMEEMVSSVLRDARLSSPYGTLEKKEFNISELITKLAKRYESQPPGVLFEKGSNFIIRGDEEKIKSALNNLIENALKYSSEQSEPVKVTLEAKDAGVTITVSDHGIGIPKEDQNLIFEPFYRVDKSRARSTGGFGLGLSLCKKIVDAHGGNIVLQSALGEGSTFKIWLPQG